MSEIENCTHDCSSCGENCPSRNGGAPTSFIEKPHEMSSIRKVIGVVSVLDTAAVNRAFESQTAAKLLPTNLKARWTVKAIDEKGNVVTHPALLFSVGKSEIPVHFGLECKWVAHMSEHGLICSGKSVLARAKVFERETRIPVFMIVAVAGLPDAPEHLYVIPVRELFSNYVVADRLMFYEKDVDEPFRFDRQNLKLY